MKYLLGLFAALVCGFGVQSGAVAMDGSHTVHVDKAWVRAAPPNAAVMAGYFILMNGSNTEQVLTGAKSDQFNKVEIHRTEMHDGMAHMIEQKELKIGVNKEVMLRPGGLHLMLIGPKAPIKEGDTVEMVLTFGSGEEMVVSAPVKKGPMGKMKMGGKEMDHSKPMDHSKHMMKH
ncbi:MAG: copper chaperone PCu(A)C [Magnetococcales bacterium]|nr:copper chaperone PCu(A)C [Magnetococcales bacterium]